MDLQRFKGIEAFLFDLGGVIIDIDVERAIEGFKKIGLNGIEDQITQSHHIGLFKAFERGDVNEQEFLSAIKKQTGNNITDDQIIEAWQSILVEFPIERVRILEKLHRNYPTYILSNTNGIHLQKFSKMAEGYHHIEELFDAAYYSFQLGCSKPEKCAFEKVIELSGLKPESTLFLDDSEINLHAAGDLGFKTQLVTKTNSIIEIFK